MSKKQKRKEAKAKREAETLGKVFALEKALNDVGIETRLETNARWFCDDNKVHVGIELETDKPDSDGERVTFHFTPSGYLIYNCRLAPLAPIEK